jgi:hypothetical protein
MEKKELEKLIQIHFGCKKLFRADGYSTSAGTEVCYRLMCLLTDLGVLTEMENEMNSLVITIDKTTNFDGVSFFKPNNRTISAHALDEVLATYFGCKKPFKKSNWDLTKNGHKAYSKLISLLYDLSKISDMGSEINDVVETLDIIVSPTPA